MEIALKFWKDGTDERCERGVQIEEIENLRPIIDQTQVQEATRSSVQITIGLDDHSICSDSDSIVTKKASRTRQRQRGVMVFNFHNGTRINFWV